MGPGTRAPFPRKWVGGPDCLGTNGLVGRTFRGVTVRARAAGCLGIGMALWVVFGAVRGARYWQISGGGYLLGLLVAGGLFGLTTHPGLHRDWVEAALLVIPGFATMATSGLGGHS